MDKFFECGKMTMKNLREKSIKDLVLKEALNQEFNKLNLEEVLKRVREG